MPIRMSALLLHQILTTVARPPVLLTNQTQRTRTFVPGYVSDNGMFQDSQFLIHVYQGMHVNPLYSADTQNTTVSYEHLCRFNVTAIPYNA